jgi:hypothetical protein
MKRALLGAVLVLSFAAHAKAQYSGNELLRDCSVANSEVTSPDKIAYASHCLGYLRGVADAMEFDIGFRSSEPASDPPSGSVGGRSYFPCIPDGASPDQLARVMVKYLNEHPEKLHQGAIALVLPAFKKAFPCPATPKP